MKTKRQELQKICPNGRIINFIMTRAKDVIWLQREEGAPYLHIRPAKDNNWSIVQKFCRGFGMLTMCEIPKPVSAISFEDICGL